MSRADRAKRRVDRASRETRANYLMMLFEENAFELLYNLTRGPFLMSYIRTGELLIAKTRRDLWELLGGNVAEYNHWIEMFGLNLFADQIRAARRMQLHYHGLAIINREL